MVRVKQCTDLNAASEFFYSIFKADLENQFPHIEVTSALLKAPLARMNLLEIFDEASDVVVGMAGMECDGHVHLHIRKQYCCRWSPHRNLQRILDFFLSERDVLTAAVSLENTNIISILFKLGFAPTGVEQGVAHFRLLAEGRRRFTESLENASEQSRLSSRLVT